MTAATLALALLALLITPGPTNSLLALSGARSGLVPSLRLIPVELAAYLAVIAPLLLWGAPLVAQLPLLRPLLAAVAALWVAWLALRLWRMPTALPGEVQAVTAGNLALTTLLNPKALVIALVLMPGLDAPAAALAIFVAVMPPVSLLWITLGAGVLSRSGHWLNRGSALWLALLSVLLAARAMAG